VARPPTTGAEPGEAQFRQQIAAKAARKLDARRHPARIVWFGLGMMGVIGWSVTVPALLGAALGAWLDRHHPAGHSWTLALLVAGLTLGCWNAWHWVTRESREMHSTGGADND
jgi:ATP synthase protein I